MLAIILEKSSPLFINLKSLFLILQRAPQNWMLVQPFSTPLPDSKEPPELDARAAVFGTPRELLPL